MAITALLYKLLGAGNDDKAQAEAVMLTGIIQPTGWDGTDQPGWLYCDGRSLLRADYPALFTAIGTRFGTADGTHFNIPDLEGRFLRGFDNAAGRDPDTATRTAMATGGNSGDNVGSVQADAMQGHFHKLQLNGSGTAATVADAGSAGSPFTGITKGPAAGGSVGIADAITDGSHGTPRVSNETRPLNAAVAFYIKT